MSIDSFPALVARSDNGALHVALDTVDSSLLAEGDVLVRVSYSSLNYKDALGVSGKEKIFRTYPSFPALIMPARWNIPSPIISNPVILFY